MNIFGESLTIKLPILAIMLLDRTNYRSTEDDESSQARRRPLHRAEEIRREEFETAISRLEAQTELTESERQIIADLAENIVKQVISGPNSTLEGSSQSDQNRTIATPRQSESKIESAVDAEEFAPR